MATAAPWPVFGRCDEAALDRVAVDVAELLDLGIPATSLSGYAGGSICSLTVACAGGQSDLNSPSTNYFDVESGDLTLVSNATPEPSTVALLGTGLLGLAGVVRRLRA